MIEVTKHTELVFETESGSKYEIANGKVRRVNETASKRGDGEWFTLVSHPEIYFHPPFTLIMESLSEYGVDDFGNAGGTEITMRLTSPVTNITLKGQEEGE